MCAQATSPYIVPVTALVAITGCHGRPDAGPDAGPDAWTRCSAQTLRPGCQELCSVVPEAPSLIVR